MPVWGHATDDQHDLSDRFIGWNRVQWPVDVPVTAAGIIDALGRGCFTASTGVSIEAVGVDEHGAYVESDADEVHWVGNGGQILRKESGGNSRLSLTQVLDTGLTGEALYVRAECFGRGAAMAWSQPFWLERP